MSPMVARALASPLPGVDPGRGRPASGWRVQRVMISTAWDRSVRSHSLVVLREAARAQIELGIADLAVFASRAASSSATFAAPASPAPESRPARSGGEITNTATASTISTITYGIGAPGAPIQEFGRH